MKYTSETTIYNKDAIGDGIDNAAKRADDFMEYKDGTLTVGKKNGSEWTGTRAAMDNDSFDILDADGIPVASYGATATIGNTDSKHMVISSDGITMKDGTKNVAEFESSNNASNIKLVGTDDTSYVRVGTTSATYENPGIMIFKNGQEYAELRPTSFGTQLSGRSNTTGNGAFWIDAYNDPNVASSGTLAFGAKTIRINNETLADFVIENGSDSNGWYYRKYKSGRMEAWRRISLSTGTMTLSNNIPRVTKSGYMFPTEFISEPYLNLTNVGGYLVCVGAENKNAVTFDINITRLASSSTSSINLKIEAYAFGWWKS